MFYFRLKMSEVDDEVYSTIFSALRHGVRRRILRMLSEGHMSFTSLYETLGVSSSHLTYHLDSLGELVSKNDAKYKLSVFGRAAYDMMNNVENPPASFDLIRRQSLYKVVSSLLLIVLVVVSGFYVNLNNLSISQEKSLMQKDAVIGTMTQSLEYFTGFSELIELVKEKSSIHITSRHDMSYRFSRTLEPDEMCRDSILVFYSPQDELVLHIDLMSTAPDGLYIPLTLQQGYAFRNESSILVYSEEVVFEKVGTKLYKEWQSRVLWSVNSTGPSQSYDIVLPAEGWYTLSLVGPVTVEGSGGASITASGWGNVDIWMNTGSFRAGAYCQLLKDGERVVFAMETDEWYGLTGMGYSGVLPDSWA
jgi:hypothetical protein